MWVLILFVALGTQALRLSFIFVFGWVENLSSFFESFLRFVPPCVLAALVLPSLVYEGDTLVLSVHNERFLAGLLAAVVAWWTESMLATISVGMGTLWVLTFLL